MAKAVKEDNSKILSSNEDKATTTVRKHIAVEPKTYPKSRKRTSLQEFAFVNNLRPEILAGFKAWLHGDYYHSDEEWKVLFDKYKTR